MAARRLLPAAQLYFPMLPLAGMMFLAISNAWAEARPTSYVVRLAHETSTSATCVLLDESGVFHLESDDGQQTKVYEGQISTAQLDLLRQNLGKLSQVRTTDIEEPLIPGPRDLLDIHIFEGEGAKELRFRSRESQQPYAAQLNPLLSWMGGLRKLPHLELSEDEGKRNCLPRRELALKKRSQTASLPPPASAQIAGLRMVPPAKGPTPSPPLREPLVRLELRERTSSDARLTCALIADEGQYRFERRIQKNGSTKVENSLAKGRFTAEELAPLRTILESPALVSIRHREPPDRMPLNIKGVVLELSINRGSGVQDLILTDSTRRNTFFYSGDADIGSAAPLLGFVRKQIAERSVSGEKVNQLNGCSRLP